MVISWVWSAAAELRGSLDFMPFLCFELFACLYYVYLYERGYIEKPAWPVCAPDEKGKVVQTLSYIFLSIKERGW